jgi:hypothetical protein
MGNWNTVNQHTAYQHAKLSAKCQQYRPDKLKTMELEGLSQSYRKSENMFTRKNATIPTLMMPVQECNNNKDKINIKQYGRKTS